MYVCVHTHCGAWFVFFPYAHAHRVCWALMIRAWFKEKGNMHGPRDRERRVCAANGIENRGEKGNLHGAQDTCLEAKHIHNTRLPPTGAHICQSAIQYTASTTHTYPIVLLFWATAALATGTLCCPSAPVDLGLVWFALTFCSVLEIVTTLTINYGVK